MGWLHSTARFAGVRVPAALGPLGGLHGGPSRVTVPGPPILAWQGRPMLHLLCVVTEMGP